MASLRKRSKSPFYVACFYDHDGLRTQRSTGTAKRSDAMRLAIEWEKAAREARGKTLTVERARRVLNEMLSATGQSIDNESTRVFALRWLATKKSTRSKHTLETYTPMIDGFIAALGKKADAPLSAIMPAEVEAHRDALKATGRKPTTLRQHIKVIGAMFSAAHRQGLIQGNPAKGVEMDNTTQDSREPFTQIELTALLKEARGDWETAIMLGAYAGMRIGDVIALRWDSVDLAAGTLTFTPQKTSRSGRSLILPLHPSLLENLMKQAGDDPHALICPTLAGRIGGRSGTSRQFLELMKRAGIDNKPRPVAKGEGRTQSTKSFHSLRHTFNSSLLAAGVDERVRMALSAHTTAHVNRKYSHAEMSSLRDAVHKLPKP